MLKTYYWKNGIEIPLNNIALGIGRDIVFDKGKVYIAGYINIGGGKYALY